MMMTLSHHAQQAIIQCEEEGVLLKAGLTASLNTHIIGINAVMTTFIFI